MSVPCFYGAELRYRRELAGLTLEQLAEGSFRGISFLSQIERGERSMPMDLAKHVDERLETDGFFKRRCKDAAKARSAGHPLYFQSLLAVFAHPDDESLSSGGVLAQHAAAGARTAVVTATWTPGTHRAAELAEALHILGAGVPRMLGYADLEVPESAAGKPRFCDAPLDEAIGRLVAHLRAFRPEIVVTHDAYGGLTAHPDHVHTHRVTTLAVEAAGLERLYQEAGEPWQPRALYLATHPHSALPALREFAEAGKGLNTVPDELVTATVDVRPWLERKWAAVLAHRTEVERGAAPGLLAGFPEEVRSRFLGTEWYIRHDTVSAVPVQSELTV